MNTVNAPREPTDARLPEDPSCVYCRMGAPDLCRCQQAAVSTAEQEGASVASEPKPSVEVERLREALEKQADQMNFLSRMADGQRRCERGSGPATWKTTIAAIRSEALVGEAAARAALSRKQEPGVPTPGAWIEWSGGGNPVPGKMVEVKIRWRKGEPSEGSTDSENMEWEHVPSGEGDGGDIIAYRIAPTPGGEGE